MTNITRFGSRQVDDVCNALMWRAAMGSQARLTSLDSTRTFKNKHELLQQARRLGIRSAERDKLEAMCAHAGLRHAGLSDAALRRALETVLA